MLDHVFYGNELRDWGISVLIILGALILNKIIHLLNKHVFQKMAAKTKSRFVQILFESLEAPILLGVMLGAIWVALGRLDISAKFQEVVLHAYQILTVLNATWFFSRLLTSLLEESTKKKSETGKNRKYVDTKFIPLIRRFLVGIIWVIGGITALGNVGVTITALLSALGIGGVAIALASQDLVKNLLAGVTIFTDQPFRIGDRIRFSDIDGNVEDIGLRSTRIRTLDKRIVTIPNYKIMDAAIENVNSEPMRKVVVKLALTYNTKPEKLTETMNLLKEMPQRVKYVSAKDLVVAFTEFADSALIITFIYYVEKKGNVFETNTNVNLEIIRMIEEAGVSFAYPTQTVYIEQE